MPTLRPPTVDEGIETTDPLFRYYKIKRGVTLLVSGATVTEARYPDQDSLSSYDFVYLGGHEYTISAAEATTLTNAGYGAYIT